MNTSQDWNYLTFGLYLSDGDGFVTYPVKAVITENYAESLVNIDNDIFVHRLDDFTFGVTVCDSTLTPIDVSGRTFRFTVREMYYNRVGKVLFRKESGSGITFLDAVNGVVGVEFSSDDTKSVRPTIQYKYELEMFLGVSRMTIMDGNFIVRPR